MRLFAAIELAPAFRQELIRLQGALREAGFFGLSYVKPDQLHITLKFMGNASEPALEEIVEAIDLAAEQSSPFEIALSACGCFPAQGAPQVIWAGVGAAEQPAQTPLRLLECQRLCEQCLEAAGISRDNRTFAPHITLARVKDASAVRRLRETVAALTCPALTQEVGKLVLFRSILNARGAVHEAVHTALLRG